MFEFLPLRPCLCRSLQWCWGSAHQTIFKRFAKAIEMQPDLFVSSINAVNFKYFWLDLWSSSCKANATESFPTRLSLKAELNDTFWVTVYPSLTVKRRTPIIHGALDHIRLSLDAVMSEADAAVSLCWSTCQERQAPLAVACKRAVTNEFAHLDKDFCSLRWQHISCFASPPDNYARHGTVGERPTDAPNFAARWSANKGQVRAQRSRIMNE